MLLAVDAYAPGATADGVTAVFAAFIDLLGILIGETLAHQLIRAAWPELTDGVGARSGVAGDV